MIETIFNSVQQYIDMYYLLTFMFVGYFAKRYLQKGINSILNKKVELVYIVLLLGILLAIPYVITGTSWQKLLFSYTFGTSLHEVFFSYIEKKIIPSDSSLVPYVDNANLSSEQIDAIKNKNLN